LHDSITAERLGVPALGVMTTSFASAAEMMSRMMGMPDYPFAVIAHPISTASDEALREMARITVEQVRRLLLGPQ
jgi:hypothetical protein